MAQRYGTAGIDVLIGPNEVNQFYFAPGELSPLDFIFGGTATDNIYFSGAQTLGVYGNGPLPVNYFLGASSIEFLYFDDLDDTVDIPDNLVTSTPGTATYRLIVRGGGGDDDLDASYVTSALPIWIEGEDGEDTIWGGGDGSRYTGGIDNDLFFLGGGVEEAEGGGDDDTFVGDAADVDGDTVDGGSGYDVLGLITAGTFTVDLSEIELVNLAGVADIVIDSRAYAGGEDATVLVFGDILGAPDTRIEVNPISGFVGDTYENFAIATYDGNDVIEGGAGDDTLDGGDGVDQLFGGDGDDTLEGGGDSDFMSGGSGDDVYVGFGSGDLISEWAGGGTDTIRTALAVFTMHNNTEILDYTGTAAFNGTGNASANTIEGSGNGDTVNGRDGDDVLNGLGGGDTLNGENNDDTLFGNDGRDTLNGGNQNDHLYGGAHNDTMDGGSGDDFLQGDDGADIIEGGTGSDTALYASATAGVDVDLRRAADQAITGAGIDQLSGIENVTGTADDDVLRGDDFANVLIGGGGEDTLAGHGGADTLDGGTEDDILKPGAGDDTAIGGGGFDTVDYSASEAYVSSTYLEALGGTLATGADIGTDDLSSIEAIIGGGGGDFFSGWLEAHGGAGDDRFDGNLAVNAFYGDEGTDTVRYFDAPAAATLLVDLENPLDNRNAAEGDTLESIENITYFGINRCDLFGDANANRLEAGGAFSNLSGRGGGDTLVGTGFAEILDGGADFDTADYSAAASGIVIMQIGAALGGDGGAGGDAIVNVEAVLGSAFDDEMTVLDTGFTLSGLGGADTLSGGIGSDTLDGGAGADTLAAGAGNDFYVLDETGDTVAETLNAGIDQVKTTLASYALGANVEKLLFTDTGPHTGKGNGLGNQLNGNGGADKFLVDEGGADIFSAGLGSDSMDFRASETGVILNFAANIHGGAAVGDIFASIEKFFGSDTAGDTMAAGAGRVDFSGFGGGDTLSGGISVDKLSGGSGADTLDGAANDDTLQGGKDADTLAGGTGADFFLYVETAASGGWGADTVADFEDGVDRIKVDSPGVAASIADFTIAGNGTASVLLTLNALPSSAIALNGASPISITAADFLFF